MEMKVIQFDSSVFGEVYEYIMPLPGVFYIRAKCDEGIVMTQEAAETFLSAKARDLAIYNNAQLYFDWYRTGKAVRYELLSRYINECDHRKIAELLTEELEHILQDGRIDLPEYFGEYAPPNETPLGIVEHIERIGNGIYFVQACGKSLVAICDHICHSELSDIACLVGTAKKDYLFFDRWTCAIPLHELRNHAELCKVISSWNQLYAVLNVRFYVYVLENNSKFPNEQHIPETTAAGDEFLYWPSWDIPEKEERMVR